MGCFDDEKNVADYIRMADGYEGKELVIKLEKYLKAGSTLLELGMGPGKDLDMLIEKYKVTGSDNSQVFLDRYHKMNPKAELLKLDAVTLETEKQFDCIYSNKALHHLTPDELVRSLQHAREKIEVIRLFVRLMKDLKQISLQKFVQINQKVENVSKQLTGWQKSVT